MQQLSVNHRERGQWAVYYTSPQSFFLLAFINWLNNFGDFGEFNLIALSLEFKRFKIQKG